MPTYTIQAPDGRKVTVQADSQDAAISGVQDWVKSNPAQPDQKAPYGVGGMVAKAVGAPAKRSFGDDVMGVMANVNRGLGVGDELNAGLNAVADIVTGKAKVSPFSPGAAISDIGHAFSSRMAQQRATEDSYSAAHPKAAALARGTGMAATALVPAGGTATTIANGSRVANVARGAVSAGLNAAAYSALDRGSLGDRVKAASAASVNPVALGLGGLAGGFAPARARAPRPGRTPSPQQILTDSGVSLTPGQRIGGLAKNAEDLAQRAPILGPAISAARQRGNVSLNRSVGLSALHPIGEGIPINVRPGYDTVRYVENRLGGAYDRAANMVDHVNPDQPLLDDIQRIQGQSASLPDSLQPAFGRIVLDRLRRLDGGIDGAGLKAIHSELGDIQRHYSSAGGPEGIVANQIGDLRTSLMDLLGRQNPEARDLINRADHGWAVYSVMNDAAANADKHGGVFTPGQLVVQSRASARRVGSNMAGKGEGTLRELAGAAQRVMPDEFGNPGTANAIGLGSGAVGLVTHPVATIGGAAGLTAAATPYFMMGRRILTALPPNATAAQLNSAAQTLTGLAARDPAVAALQRELATRAARVVPSLQQREPATSRP